MTKHLLRNSSGLQAVLCINNNSVICPIRYAYTNHNSQSKFWVQDFTKTCCWTTNTKWSFFMQFISDLSKDITRLAQQLLRTFFDGHKITHSCMIFVFMAQFLPPDPTQFVSFLHTVRIPAMTSFLFEGKKKRKAESYIDWIFQWLSVYRDLYSSSSSWLAAGNSREEEPSSVLETHCQPDETTIERHTFDDVVTLCSKNGKKSRKQQISECITWYNK